MEIFATRSRACALLLIGMLTMTSNAGAGATPAVAPAAAQASSTSQLQATPAARVQRLEGQGWVIHRDESREALSSGQAIFNGDSIETAANSTTQLYFSDNSQVSLRASSQLAIKEYSWDPAKRSGNAALELIKGAFRAITGLIGDKDPDSYTVETPIALIGIRGTDFGARYCAEATCNITHNGDNLTLSRGIYIGVLRGSIIASSQAAKHVVHAGEAIYQKDTQTAPQPIQNLPGIIFNSEEFPRKKKAVALSDKPAVKTKSKAPAPPKAKDSAVINNDNVVSLPADYAAFITNANKEVLRDSFGNCLRSSAYHPDHGVSECR